MKRSKSLIPAGDTALFQAAVRGTTPIADVGRISVSRQQPTPIQSMIDDFDPIDELRNTGASTDLAQGADTNASFIRDGFSPLIVRRLRRGEWPVEDELDLHGASQLEARGLLGDFLKRAARGRRYCVRIIHGKGIGSVNRVPVLKIKVRHWLASRDDVIAYCEAPPAMGGGGALLVLMKR